MRERCGETCVRGEWRGSGAGRAGVACVRTALWGWAALGETDESPDSCHAPALLLARARTRSGADVMADVTTIHARIYTI